jgi:branched-chain amino acid transport system ATP-binding protein
MRVISGMIRRGPGSIHMEGRGLDGGGAASDHRARIAHVPENRRLFPRLTVEGNLRMGAFTPSARAKFAERLKFVFDLFPRMKERRNQLAAQCRAASSRCARSVER